MSSRFMTVSVWKWTGQKVASLSRIRSKMLSAIRFRALQTVLEEGSHLC